jgi:hypothetical protein
MHPRNDNRFTHRQWRARRTSQCKGARNGHIKAYLRALSKGELEALVHRFVKLGGGLAGAMVWTELKERRERGI